jgi:Ca2+-binding RTX toxin-like protein
MSRRCAGVLLATVVLSAGVLAIPPAAGAEPVTCEGVPVTVVGTRQGDTLVGTPGADVIAGLGGDDDISGLGGDDVICGGTGADVLAGGPGDDRIHGGPDGIVETASPGGAEYLMVYGADRARGGAGDDWIDLGYDPRQVSLQSDEHDEVQLDGAHGTVLHLAGPGGTSTAIGNGRDRIVGQRVLDVVGSDGPDRIWGSDRREYINGGPGDDELHGLGGNDVLDDGGRPGSWGTDQLFGDRGSDSLTSHGGPDQLLGGPGGDYLTAGRGSTADAGPGFDTLGFHRAGGGCATLLGRTGYDVLYLQAARTARNAVIRLDLDGGPLGGCGAVAGMEEVTLYSAGSGSFPTWDVRGTDRTDRIQLQDRARLVARLRGGDDYVSSGDGNDLLWGGTGTDYAYAGRGYDYCRGFETADRCEDDR